MFWWSVFKRCLKKVSFEDLLGYWGKVTPVTQCQTVNGREFPGGPVVSTRRFHCRGPGCSIPGRGTKIPQAKKNTRKQKQHQKKHPSEWLFKVSNKTYLCYAVLSLQVRGGFILTIWLSKGNVSSNGNVTLKFEADLHFGPQSQRYMNYHVFTYTLFVFQLNFWLQIPITTS